MLKLKYLVENFALARLALTHWAHDETALDERLGWFRISSNAVYPFDRDGRLCFLRLSPAEEKAGLELLGEVDFLEYLRRCGYPAMRVIPADSGELLLPLDTPWGLWYASAFQGVAGQPLEALHLTEELAREYGASLGGLHALSMNYAPPMKRRSHADALAWIERTLTEHGAPEAALLENREVTRLLARKPRTRQNYGLIHYDFEPDNVFWDGRRCYAIDFEDGMLHFYAADIVQALDEIPEGCHGSFLQGYAAACSAVCADPADFPLMRRFRDLYSYARLLHSLSEKPSPEPDWLPQLIARLKGRLSELECTVCHHS